MIDECLQVADPLAAWRWKLGGAARVVALTRSGDAFFASTDGQISWLDTGAGEVSPVAPSREEFERMLERPSDAARLLLAPVVEEFIRLHGPFSVGYMPWL